MTQIAEKKAAKGKLAIYWAASCGGCEISLLQIDAKILDVDAAFDLVFCPCLADGKVRDIERMADGQIDVCLFNGGIRNSEQEYMARLLRRKSKVLVAFGSCARKAASPGWPTSTTASRSSRRFTIRIRPPRRKIRRMSIRSTKRKCRRARSICPSSTTR